MGYSKFDRIATAKSSLQLNDVWQSAHGGMTWTKLVDKALWAARYGLAAAFHLMPVTPAGGRHFTSTLPLHPRQS
jgi:hypothetical protein